MIYTSNYARKCGDPNAVAISASPPEYYHGERDLSIAPAWGFLGPYQDGHIGKEEYTRQYIKLLESRKRDWHNWLSGFSDPTYFLCFESPGEFCHRRIFAEWVELKCGWVIPEWKNEKELEEQRQLEVVDDLFNF